MSKTEDSVGLTEKEQKVLDSLAQAWNDFLLLPHDHPDHIEEFRRAIHSAQYLIGVRVAKRVDPWMWWKADGGAVK